MYNIYDILFLILFSFINRSIRNMSIYFETFYVKY